MRHIRERDSNPLPTGDHPEYLRGYRDGIRDRRGMSRPAAGDGILGALLAIALIAGVSYFGYNYAKTGRFLPVGVEINPVPTQPPTR